MAVFWDYTLSLLAAPFLCIVFSLLYPYSLAHLAGVPESWPHCIFSVRYRLSVAQ